ASAQHVPIRCARTDPAWAARQPVHVRIDDSVLPVTTASTQREDKPGGTMTETSTGATTESRQRIRIFINDQPYLAPERAMTGRDLLALAGLPEGNQLFLDVPGPGDDTPVNPDAPFDLKPGMKFYDVPVGTFG